MNGSGRGGRTPPLLAMVGLAVSYFVLSEVGLRWATVSDAASPVYPAAGMALAGLVLGGLRLWPAIFIGRMAAFLVEASPLPFWVKVAIAGGNALAAVAGTMALQRTRLKPSLPRLRDVLAFIAAALGSSALAAIVGAGALAGALGHGLGQAGVTWFNWWTGDLVGVLVVTPLVLSWARGELEDRGLWWWLHLVLSTVTAGAFAWFIFARTTSALFLPWVLFPVLIWAAMASGVQGASTALAPVLALSVWGTTRGLGPFAATTSSTLESLRFALLQQFIGSAAVTALVLAVVADERRSSEIVRQNEERLDRASRVGRIGIWEWNITTGAGFWSPEACEIFGHEANCTVDYERWLGSIHPEDRESAARATERALVQGQSDPGAVLYKDEYRVLHRDGTIVWVEASGAFESKGEGLLMLGVVRDLTERRLAEAALRESEERFHTAARATNDAIWDWDFATDTIWWNDGVQTLFGYAPAAVDPDATWWYEHIHPEDRERVVAGIHAVIDNRQEVFWRDEYRYLRADGTYSDIWDRGYVMRDATGKGVRMIGAMQDVTARKQANEALRESEARFRALADNISQLAWMTDATGWIFWYNRRWFDYTGATLEEMQGWGWQKVHHPDHIQRVLDKFRHHLASGEPWEDTFPLRGQDGEYRWFLSRALPIRDDAGKIVRWFGTNTDITVQREAEETLRQAIQLRDEFLSVASHELRTPLTALSLQLEVLHRVAKQIGNDGHRLTQKVDMAIRQSERLGTLVGDLLNVSRMSSGRLQIHLETFDLRDLIRETVDRLEEVASKAQCEIRLQLGDAVVGTWDRSRLDQVLMNLLSNAMKYGAGSPVDVGLQATDELVELTVRDRGIGIQEADQKRIFGRFERAVSVRHYGGLGLGLYIARQIVDAHGGTIEVQSVPGSGATFIVRLPRVTRPSLAA